MNTVCDAVVVIFVGSDDVVRGGVVVVAVGVCAIVIVVAVDVDEYRVANDNSVSVVYAWC